MRGGSDSADTGSNQSPASPAFATAEAVEALRRVDTRTLISTAVSKTVDFHARPKTSA
jgi:hypothetical protein